MKRLIAKRVAEAVTLALMIGAFSLTTPSQARAQSPQCHKQSGKFYEYVVDPFLSPSDPFGRVVNQTDGTLQTIGTAILTSVGPGPTPGTISATTRHAFVLNERDQITATGVAVFTPKPGSPDVADVLTLTITGGLGRYASATGTLVATGTGYNFFPLPPGPTAGRSFFVFTYKGEICGVEQ